MARHWLQDKRWTDLLLPQVKQIVADALGLGRELIQVAGREEDAMHNTDLIVLQHLGTRIGVRIRDNRYYTDDYMKEFTIRSVRPGERDTELQKILQGWGDYFLYGFADATKQRLVQWLLVDLAVFRDCYRPGLGKPKRNPDGSSDFEVFSIMDFPYSLYLIFRQDHRPCTATKS